MDPFGSEKIMWLVSRTYFEVIGYIAIDDQNKNLEASGNVHGDTIFLNF